MSRWWENERSKTAAAVRATRRRLRAGFRGALAVEIARVTVRLEADYRAKCARLAEAEELARDAAREMSHPRVMVLDYQLEKRLGCELTIHRDLFLRIESPERLIGAVCQHLGNMVEHETFKYARNETRGFGRETLRFTAKEPPDAR